VKAILLDPHTALYAQPDTSSPVVTLLREGDEIAIGAIKKKGGHTWATVTLPDTPQCYMQGTARIRRLREVRLLTAFEARTEPSTEAPVLDRYPWGTTLIVLEAGEQAWIKVRDGQGREAFLPATTALEDAGEVARAAAIAAVGKRNMIVGGIWCVGGTAVTIGTYTAASGGGTYVVAWGAIIFGGYQFLKGLGQYTGGD
jgi:hypothetical protein